MEKYSVLYSVCLNDKNVNALIDVIRDDIKLSERSIPKCITMITEIMKKNIGKLSRQPKDKEELKEIVRHLNKICINTIIEIIIKKYPDLHVSRKKQMSKEQMRRELDVWGERENHLQERPHIRTRKEYNDDETSYSMKPNDIGFAGTDDSGGYASAFGDHLITNIQTGQQQQNPYNNPHSQKDSNQMEQRYQQKMNERNQGMGQQRPPTPDFTLDGSGERVRMEKMRRQLENNQMHNMGGMNSMNNMNGMMGNGMPMGMSGFGMDDPYASLLGAGAPGQTMTTNSNPLMGMGNALMPMSSTNMMADQMGLNSMMNPGYNTMNIANPTAKSMQLNNDYERKVAERRAIDIETNQPQQSSHFGNSGSMSGMPNMGMQGNMMGMQGNMGMPGTMGMPNMAMQGNMGMPGMMSMPQIGMQGNMMGMQGNMGMPGNMMAMPNMM